jgi:hypothetical protein
MSRFGGLSTCVMRACHALTMARSQHHSCGTPKSRTHAAGTRLRFPLLPFRRHARTARRRCSGPAGCFAAHSVTFSCALDTLFRCKKTPCRCTSCLLCPRPVLALDSLFRQQLNAISCGPNAANSSIWTNEQKYAIQVVTQYPSVCSLKIEKKAVGSQRSALGERSSIRPAQRAC